MTRASTRGLGTKRFSSTENKKNTNEARGLLLEGIAREGRVWVGLSLATIFCIGAYKYLVHDRAADAANASVKDAQSALRDGNSAKAVKSYKVALGQIEDAQPGTFGSKSRYAVLLALAETLEEQGDRRGAENAYWSAAQAANPAEELLKDSSGSSGQHDGSRAKAMCLDKLAQLLQERGNYGEALQNYLAALASLVQDPFVVEQCWKVFSEAQLDSKRDSNSSNTLLEESIDNDKKDWRGALADIDRAIDTAGILNNIGMLYLENGRDQEARAVFGRCLAVAKCCIPLQSRDESFRQAIKVVQDIYFEQPSG